MALKRIQREILEMKRDAPPSITAEPDSNDIFKWKASFIGPKDTPYQDGVFLLSLSFPVDYPFKPPKVLFVTKVYHPNILPSGEICLGILKEKWSPALSVSKLLLSVCSLLDDPSTEYALLPELLHLFKNDRELFNKNAREWTTKYAREKRED